MKMIPGFKVHMNKADGSSYINKTLGLYVIDSVSKESDGKLWQHVSLSRKSRLPTYDDIKLVKSLFIGDNKDAIQVFPKIENHVNIHPYCLHLWSCLEGSPLPDFTHGTGMI